jgi:putative YphP/YqiW family bacilliredoxin
MYPPELVAPMKSELIEAGFIDLDSAESVDNLIASEGTVFLVINSVCGCAARNARPAAKLAVQYAAKKPTKVATVFAGVDREATAQARAKTLPYPPSSPSMALFKDGNLVHFIERHQIEGNTAQDIAKHLLQAFDTYC